MTLSPTARAILTGTLVVGVLDGLDAIVFFALRGVSADRVFQGIASGLLGRAAAVRGGLSTALLGLALHFFIALGVVTVYALASRRLGVLVRRPVLCGLVYGVLVWLVMNFVVIPLSALTPGPRNWIGIANGVLAHLFLVGLPTALIVSRARRSLTLSQ